MTPASFHPGEQTFISPDPEIADLPVLKIVHPQGPALVSCWRLGWRERLRVLLGHPVFVGILGEAQPPIFLDIGMEFRGVDE